MSPSLLLRSPKEEEKSSSEYEEYDVTKLQIKTPHNLKDRIIRGKYPYPWSIALNAEDYTDYIFWYDFVNNTNQKSTETYELAEDIDKNEDVKKGIAKIVQTYPTFHKQKLLVLNMIMNLGVVDDNLVLNYW
jgi:hypothetical protein